MPLSPTPNFPASLDAFPDPTESTYIDDDGYELDLLLQKHGNAIELVEAKVGVSASTPTRGLVLLGGATAGESRYARARLQNRLPNGGQERWSFGTSVNVAASTTSANGGAAADGWCLRTNANQASNVSRQAGLSDQSQYSARVRRDSGQTGTGVMVYEHAIETVDIVKFRGKKVSLTCLVKAGANYSPSSGNLAVKVYCGTGSEGRRGAGFTGETTLITHTEALTTNAATLALTSSVVVPTNATQMSVCFEMTPVGTASTEDAFYVDDIMLVEDDVPMAYYDRPDDERACQRLIYAVPIGEFFGALQTGLVAIVAIPLPVDMRATPALVHGIGALGTPSTTTVGIYRWASAAYLTGTLSTFTIWNTSKRNPTVRLTTSGGGFSAGAAGDDVSLVTAQDGLIWFLAGL